MKRTVVVLSFIVITSHLSAQSWIAVGGGTSDFVNILYTDTQTNLLYASGQFGFAGGVSCGGLAQWDGSKWSRIGKNASGNAFCLTKYKGNLYGGGNFWLGANINSVQVAKWDGVKWDSIGNMGINGAVYSMVEYNNALYVTGDFSSVNGLKVNNIAKWDGVKWDSVGKGTVSNNFITSCLSVYRNKLYVGGGSQIYRTDGTNWEIVVGVQGGIGGYVQTLQEYKNELYVGGDFTTVGGVSAKNIVKWNDTIWSVASGLDGRPITEMITYNNELYTNGGLTFLDSSGSPSGCLIAKWNGSKWSPLGVGSPSMNLFTLAVYHNEVYAGGSFLTAKTNYIEKWSEPLSVNEHYFKEWFSIYPNPAKDNTIIEYTLPQGSSKGELLVYNLQGQEVKRVAVSSGSGKVEFNSGELQAGTYIYQLKGDSFLMTKKMVVVK